MSSNIDKRLADLGITLPEPGRPAGNYVPFVIASDLAYMAGQVAREANKMIDFFRMLPDARWLQRPCHHIPDRHEYLVRFRLLTLICGEVHPAFTARWRVDRAPRRG